VLDKRYDVAPVYEACEDRDIRDRVWLHADLTILAKLASRLAQRASLAARGVSSTLTDPHGKVVASHLAAAGLRLRSTLPTPLPESASDGIVARERFPQCLGTNAETRPMIASPSVAGPS
jgi:hypothetical protein